MSNLFLTNIPISSATPNGIEVTRHKLDGVAGSSSTLRNQNTQANPSQPIKLSDSTTAGVVGSSIAWYSDQLQAVTIAGQIVCSMWCQESANAANVAPTVGILRCDANGAELSTIVAWAANLGGGEMVTTAGAKVITILVANVISTTLASGDRLKVQLGLDNAVDQGGSGTMASGQNAQFFVNGPTGSAGQSQIAFTEPIVAQSSVIVPVRPRNITPMVRSSYW